MEKFLVLGGDLRFIYAAAKLNKKHRCAVYGFDTLHDDVRRETGVTVLKRIERCKNVILPLPMSRNCDYITAPYYSGRIPLSAVIGACEENATVYCGKACPEMYELCEKKSLRLVDYFEREELTVVNAAIAAFEISPTTPQSRLYSGFVGLGFCLRHKNRTPLAIRSAHGRLSEP
ncbi:MAG: hypothetical protein FWG45_01340 [Oscillospiraceae bacterium]|nr:hypothetical protein [Oscillospiraceae bacterium]